MRLAANRGEGEEVGGLGAGGQVKGVLPGAVGGEAHFLAAAGEVGEPGLYRIFNPPTLTLLQVFLCFADCKSLY